MNEDKISVGLTLDTSEYDKNMEFAEKKLEEFGDKFLNPFIIDIDMGEPVLDGIIDEAIGSLNKLHSKLQSLSDGLISKQERLKDITAKYNELNESHPDWDATKSYGNMKEGLEVEIQADEASIQNTKTEIENIKQALEQLANYEWLSDIDIGDALPESQALIENFEGVRDWSALIGESLKKIPGLIKNCLSGMASFLKKTKDVVAKFNPLGKIVARVGDSIRRQMVTAIASALNPINNFKKAFSYLTDVISPRLGATFKNIGNNLTEYIANSPAFKTLINDVLYFIKLLEIAWNKLASLLGIGKLDLFKTSAKSAKEMEKSTKGAASAAKSLAGFDEINNIGNQGGGGGSGADTTPMSAGELFSTKDLDLSIFDYVNDKIDKLHETITSIDFYSVGDNIADGINSFVTKINWGKLTNTISKGFQGIFKTVTGIWTNLDFSGIGATITDVFNNLDLSGIGATLSEALISVFTGLGELLAEIDWAALGTQIAEFFLSIDWWGLIVSIIELVGNLLISAGELLWSFISTLLNGIWTKFYAWFSKTPFGKTVVDTFKSAWEMVKAIWDVVGPYFEILFNFIKDTASVIWEQIKNVFILAWEAIKIVWNVVTSYFQAIWNHIKGIFSVVKSVLSGDFQGAWEGIKGIWDNAKNYFTNIWNNIKSVFSAVGTFFKNTFKNAWDGVKAVFTGVKEFFDTYVLQPIKNILNGIIGVFEGMVNGIVNGLNVFIRAINKIGFDVPDWVPKIGGKRWGFDIKELNTVSIPRLATGTNYVPEDTYAMIHEGEAVIPKEFNKDEFFGRGTEETNSLLEQLLEAVDNIEVNPYTTIQDVGTAAVDYINTEKRVLGRSVV